MDESQVLYDLTSDDLRPEDQTAAPKYYSLLNIIIILLEVYWDCPPALPVFVQLIFIYYSYSATTSILSNNPALSNYTSKSFEVQVKQEKHVKVAIQ